MRNHTALCLTSFTQHNFVSHPCCLSEVHSSILVGIFHFIVLHLKNLFQFLAIITKAFINICVQILCEFRFSLLLAKYLEVKLFRYMLIVYLIYKFLPTLKLQDISILIKYLFFKFQCIGLSSTWYKFLHMASGKGFSSVFLPGNPVIDIPASFVENYCFA